MSICTITYFTVKKGEWDKYVKFLNDNNFWRDFFNKNNVSLVITAHNARNSLITIAFWNSQEDHKKWLSSQIRDKLEKDYIAYPGDTFKYEITWDQKGTISTFDTGIVRVSRYTIKKGDHEDLLNIAQKTHTVENLDKFEVSRDIILKSMTNQKTGAAIGLWRSHETIEKYENSDERKSFIDNLIMQWDIREFELLSIREPF